MSKNITSIIDLISRNNGHEMFNFSILKALDILGKDRLRFLSRESNIGIFKKIKDSHIQLIKVREHYGYVLSTSFYFYRYVVFVRSKKTIFLSFDNTLMPVLFVLNSLLLFFREKRYTIVLHNNLSTLKKNRIKRAIFITFIAIYKPKIIVLTVFIKREFDKILNYDNVICCPHQNYHELLRNEFLSLEPAKMRKGVLRIAVTSTHSKAFLEQHVCSFIENKNNNSVIISYVGAKTHCDSEIFVRSPRPLDLLDYYKYINSSDFIFFPLEQDLNSRASGVLIDALSLGVNFIGPNLGHFKDINDAFGLGILYESYEDLEYIFLTLHDYVNPDVDRYIRSTDVNTFVTQL